MAQYNALMARYKYEKFLTKVDVSVYDELHEPGTAAPNPGIYRCISCGDEIAIAGGHTLPPQNHRQHDPAKGKIKWQLIVYSVSLK